MSEYGDGRVIIVGAGPVGLGAALELARCGVRSVLVEKHDGTSWHPKTRNFNTRTMEIARGWGPAVYKRLRSIDTPPGWKSPIRFMRTATGEEFGVIESKGFEGPGPDVSPARPIMSSQELIEAILLDAVRATGMVDVRFATEATKLVRGGSAGGRERRARGPVAGHGRDARRSPGAALVAADGSASLIRGELGIELEGSKELSHIVNCYFRADIEPHLGDRKGVLFFVANEHASGVLQPLDGAGRWLCQISVPPEEWSLDVFTHERARAWIRAAVGVDELEPEVLSLGLWKLNATVAERFVQGRVLLCGDAAHQFPPTGGLGVNTGLQGMHNAMWKLAWFVLGRAGWPLVATYETERREVAQRITSQSLQNSINVQLINAAAATGARGRAHRGAGRGGIASLRQPPRRRVRHRLPVERRRRRRHAAAGGRRQLLGLCPVGHARSARAARLARTTPMRACRRSTCSAARSRCSRRPEATRGARAAGGGGTRARRPDRPLPHRRRPGFATSAASPRRTGSATTARCSSGPTDTSPGGARRARRAPRRCAMPPCRFSRASESTPQGNGETPLPAGIGLEATPTEGLARVGVHPTAATGICRTLPLAIRSSSSTDAANARGISSTRHRVGTADRADAEPAVVAHHGEVQRAAVVDRPDRMARRDARARAVERHVRSGTFDITRFTTGPTCSASPSRV